MNVSKQTEIEPVRLSLDSTFKFRCHKGLDCFTHCCARTTIRLTPYDILRLRHRLGISSGEFLKRYTRQDHHEKTGLPVVILDMSQDPEGRCPFVSPEGCSVYEDRPVTCRYYPLGQGSVLTDAGLEEFYVYIQEEHCQGFGEESETTVEAWRREQGAEKYDEMNREWKIMMLLDYPQDRIVINDRIRRLFYMVAYDLDQFRKFVFESPFLNVFEIGPDLLARIKTDDEELLRFGYQYLKHMLMITPTLKMSDEASQLVNPSITRLDIEF
ncbi:MAG: YkgJ family cysteine cluster protein [Deltaproteobacteria bacterium]|nr:YkgJ family cysteine cluster protein [Deltaproteobacteria bacterium]